MSDAPGGWKLERLAGRAGDLHRVPDPDETRRTVRVLDVESPAIVLGSSQRDVVVDTSRARSTGVDVVRRRSGGGAVLLVPGEQAWIDLLVPAGDPLWNDDVVVAAFWAGETWATALDRLGLGPAVVHRGRQLKTEWSGLVCFSGLGPGEVTINGHKVVGLSQRRTRSWTRIQTTAFTNWSPERTVELLDLTPSRRDSAAKALSDGAGMVPAETDELVAAVLGALPPQGDS